MAHNWLLPGWSLMKFVTMMIHEDGQFSQFSSRFQILSPRRRVCFARGRDLLQRGPRARREVSLLCNMFVCNDFLLKTGLCIKVSCVICIFNIHSHYAYLLDICYTVRCTCVCICVHLYEICNWFIIHIFVCTMFIVHCTIHMHCEHCE